MALARIITRSHACSRELALDLLARGYAVEIVSPDRIPNNLADLELRVDAEPGDQLIANVETHAGGRPASLEFVHHLRAPMADFIRRPPHAAESVREPVNVHVEPGVPGVEDTELPAKALQPTPKAVTPTEDLLLAPNPGFKEQPRRVSPPERIPPVPIASPNYAASSTIVQPRTTVPPIAELPRRERPVRSVWSAALTCACVVLLAVIFWFGVRQNAKAAQTSVGAQAQKIVPASSPAKKSGTSDPGKIRKHQNALPVANAGASAAKPSTDGAGGGIPSKHYDYVARDTVTYLDHRTAEEAAARAKPAKGFAGRHAISSKPHGGVVAANSVTYLNNTPPAKAAK